MQRDLLQVGASLFATRVRKRPESGMSPLLRHDCWLHSRGGTD
jgi:hypothetical protein